MYLGYNESSDHAYLASTAVNSNPDLWKVTKTGAGEQDFTLTAIGSGSELPAFLSYDHTSCSSDNIFLSKNITDERSTRRRWLNGTLIAAVRSHFLFYFKSRSASFVFFDLLSILLFPLSCIFTGSQLL